MNLYNKLSTIKKIRLSEEYKTHPHSTEMLIERLENETYVGNLTVTECHALHDIFYKRGSMKIDDMYELFQEKKIKT